MLSFCSQPHRPLYHHASDYAWLILKISPKPVLLCGSEGHLHPSIPGSNLFSMRWKNIPLAAFHIYTRVDIENRVESNLWCKHWRNNLWCSQVWVRSARSQECKWAKFRCFKRNKTLWDVLYGQSVKIEASWKSWGSKQVLWSGSNQGSWNCEAATLSQCTVATYVHHIWCLNGSSESKSPFDESPSPRLTLNSCLIKGSLDGSGLWLSSGLLFRTLTLL